MAKKRKLVTHAPTETKVHIVLWNENTGDFWVKELPGKMTDSDIYRYINSNLERQPIKVYRGKEIILRGRR